MNWPFNCRNLAGLLLIPFAFGAALRAEEAPEAASAKIALPPGTEVKYDAFLKKLEEVRRADWNTRVEKEIGTLSATVTLTPAQLPAVQEAGRQAVDASTTVWMAKADELFRKTLLGQPKQAEKLLSEASGMAEVYVKQNFIGEDTVAPADQKTWVDSLARILAPEQAALWRTAQEKQRGELEKQVAEMLKPIEERIRVSCTAPYLNKAGEIRHTLNLDKERGEKLDTLARSLADGPIAAWRKTALRQFSELSDAERRDRTKTRRFDAGTPVLASEEQEKAWKAGVSAVLTPEEIGKLSATKGERKERRVHAMGQVMVQVLDEKLALTARQREQLQPLAEKLVKEIPALMRTDDPNRGYYSLSTEVFLAAGAKATDAELQPVLDEAQFKHWRAYCVAGQVDQDGDVIQEPEKDEEPGAAIKASLPADPDDFENIVSDFLYKKEALIRKKSLAAALLRAEEAGRVGGLAPETLRSLQMAARGAAEASLRDWRRDCDQNVRQNLEGANGQTVRLRLASIEDYYYMRQSGAPPESQPVWVETLKEVKTGLTPPQRDALQKEEKEREAFRNNTIVRSVIADFDQQYLLTADQHAKMEALVVAMLKEYGSELGTNFSNYDSAPWYLQPYYKFIPIAGIPEKELKETLTKEQWEGWNASREFSNCSSYWSNLQQNHERMKNNKSR